MAATAINGVQFVTTATFSLPQLGQTRDRFFPRGYQVYLQSLHLFWLRNVLDMLAPWLHRSKVSGGLR